MKFLFEFIFMIICSIGHSQSNDSIMIDYEIIDRDTNTIRVTNGKYNTPEYITRDSTYVFAHIIIPGLPMEFNLEKLTARIKQIMNSENLQSVYIWRDKKSLWMLPFSYRSKEMIKQEITSFIGIMDINKDEITILQKM